MEAQASLFSSWPIAPMQPADGAAITTTIRLSSIQFIDWQLVCSDSRRTSKRCKDRRLSVMVIRSQRPGWSKMTMC